VTSQAVLFVIPARGGSRRVPGKNLRTVAGIPLVGRAARIARLAARDLAGGPHSVICSTDSTEIAAVARAWGAEVPFLRPAELTTDTASSVDVCLHALDELERTGRTFRALVLVQPTSPLTDPADLRAAVERFDAGELGVVSVTASHPVAWHSDLDAVGALLPVDARGATNLLTGAFYVISPEELRATRAFVSAGRTSGLRVPPERSVDIDEPGDFLVAEALAAARSIRQVALGRRTIGTGPCFVIAEAGVNHNGDPALAHRLIDAAADANADAVKFQTFDPAALAAADAPLAEYQRAGAGGSHNQREMLEGLALPADAWRGLADHATERNIVFLSSPFDEASAELLAGLDVPAFKVPSGELTNHRLLERLAGFGRSLLVSTGMADMREVAEAIDVIGAAGNPPVALFHCVSSYPASAADANLHAMATLRAAFGVPTGWSDHTPGIELPTAAAALGASLLEKHLTLDRTMPGPDHAASLEPGEFAALMVAVRSVESALGNGDKVPTLAERETAAVARKSLVWTRDLEAGAVVTDGDLVAQRPGTGVSPARLHDVVGKATARPVRAGSFVAADDVDDLT
jgi:N-acetylneuraminate synthase/N,N'-diacetyllegionaminate synthase